jgi:hypothetical protein
MKIGRDIFFLLFSFRTFAIAYRDILKSDVPEVMAVQKTILRAKMDASENEKGLQFLKCFLFSYVLHRKPWRRDSGGRDQPGGRRGSLR